MFGSNWFRSEWLAALGPARVTKCNAAELVHSPQRGKIKHKLKDGLHMMGKISNVRWNSEVLKILQKVDLKYKERASKFKLSSLMNAICAILSTAWSQYVGKINYSHFIICLLLLLYLLNIFRSLTTDLLRFKPNYRMYRFQCSRQFIIH